ncbi:LOW QUALITY PROTEIN: lipoate-protein ligase A [Bacillus sp. JCM 19046]|nr:LOW QUALITY PROTEIN: lipoate-protein ligase A [Bacillus sp. JCM 19046]
MTEVWRFIDSGKQNPAYNMALDEALLNWHSEGLIPPTIRFYGWNLLPFQSVIFNKLKKKRWKLSGKKALGFVRRPTGGRGVLHEHELTYSVIVSEEHPNMPSSVTEAYRLLSNGLLEGFKQLGLDAYFSIPETEKEREALKNPRSSVCFDAPSWYELVVEGRKVAGSAQTRQKGVILQHGSILLDLDADKLFDLFHYRSDRLKQRMQQQFANKAVAINELRSDSVSMGEASRAFKLGFEKGLHIKLEAYELTPQEEEAVHKIAQSRYETDEWNFRR